MPMSPCRLTSKKPTVIQTAYWCVRTVVRFIAFCNSSDPPVGMLAVVGVGAGAIAAPR